MEAEHGSYRLGLSAKRANRLVNCELVPRNLGQRFRQRQKHGPRVGPPGIRGAGLRVGEALLRSCTPGRQPYKGRLES